MDASLHLVHQLSMGSKGFATDNHLVHHCGKRKDNGCAADTDQYIYKNLLNLKLDLNDS